VQGKGKGKGKGNSVKAAAVNLPLPSINNATRYKEKHLDGAAFRWGDNDANIKEACSIALSVSAAPADWMQQQQGQQEQQRKQQETEQLRARRAAAAPAAIHRLAAVSCHRGSRELLVMQQVQAEALQQPSQQHEAVVAEQDWSAGQLEGAAEAVADAVAEASVAAASGAIALQVIDAACQQQAGLLEQMHSLRLSSLREQAQASYGAAMMHTTAQQAGAAARSSEETARAMQLALESRLAVSNATAGAWCAGTCPAGCG